MNMKCFCYTKILVIIGGLNWGLVGIGNFVGGDWNVVNWLFTDLIGVQLLTNIVYVIIGLSAVYMLGSKR